MKKNHRAETERQIKETLGFLPEFYKALPDVGFHGAWELESELELGESELDPKTKELIGLAVASHIKCKYCIYFHTRMATHYEASDQEIREAIAMGGTTVLFSNSVTGMQIDFDGFKRDVERAIKNMSE